MNVRIGLFSAIKAGVSSMLDFTFSIFVVKVLLSGYG